MARSARDELRDELGPEFADLELRDLDPRTIVRKHIVEAMNAEDDEDEIARPAQAAGAARAGRGRAAAVRRRGDVAATRTPGRCTAAGP